MRIELKDFQKGAVARLLNLLSRAKEEVSDDRGDDQAILLSAPTAAGKTVMMAAMIEKVLGGDGGLSEESAFAPEPDAVFLWLSDQPELNEQSRRRLLDVSNRLRPERVTILDSTFDADVFEGGRVYFLNCQKLAKDTRLVRRGDDRQWPIWETIRNTQARQRGRFYLVVDEAHRGMDSSADDRRRAETIIQRFLVGDSELLLRPMDGSSDQPVGFPPVNIVIAITATSERFDRFLSGTPRTKRTHEVRPADVRDSGLIKDRIVLHSPRNVAAPWTLLEEACDRLVEMSRAWEAHTRANGPPEVVPAMIVQVANGTGPTGTDTDLVGVVSKLRERLPWLRRGQVVHCFARYNDIDVGDGWVLPHFDPSAISANPDIRVVVFKTALNTGWDCPRAEVMVSFRAAQDPTNIAQLVGRMVRTPLAQRIVGDERLNDVFLYLPFYDERELERVVDHLTSEAGSVVEAGSEDRLATLFLRSGMEDIPEALRRLPTYVVPTERKMPEVKRLVKLCRYLSQDGLDRKAASHSIDTLVLLMVERVADRMQDDPDFRDRVQNLEKVNYATAVFENGELRIENSDRQVPTASADIDYLLRKAARTLTDEVAMAYLRQRQDSDEPLRPRVEVCEMAVDEALLRTLNERAAQLYQSTFAAQRDTIAGLPDERRAMYEDLHRVGREAVEARLDLRDVIAISVPPDALDAADHLYIDRHGEFRTVLNDWELQVLEAERRGPGFLTWIRNFDRKPWALAYPYELDGIKPGYPDFLVIRTGQSGYVVDIIEPHQGADSVAKAIGLARFANRHGTEFGRIQMIRIERGSIQRLGFENRNVRERVLAEVRSEADLLTAFDRAGRERG